MARKNWFALGLATLLGGAMTVHAQERHPVVVLPSTTAQPILVLPPGAMAQAPEKIEMPQPAESSSQRELAGSIESPSAEPPKWGPAVPEDVKLLMDLTPLGELLKDTGWRVYGWVEPGYTFNSAGPGRLAVEPRENYIGNEGVLSQVAVVLEKTMDAKKDFDLGFKALPYGGADAHLLRPLGGFTTTNDRMGFDFRELYVAAHMRLGEEAHLDVKAGRMGTIIGYESAMAPYRPFYSNDYQWFYSEDGAWTGVLTNLHVSKQLDVLNGVTWGANTFFTKRSDDSICYIGQVNYWLQENKKTLFSVGTQIGQQAIFAAPGFAGDWLTTFEVRLQHQWTDRLLQVLQTNFGWEYDVPGYGTVNWDGYYTILVYHATKTLSPGVRAEIFADPQGSRTGVPGNFSEVTLNVDWHPYKWVRIRPEVRGDFAENPAFGPHGDRHSLFTAAIDVLLQF
jgi:hypothetical protein